MSSARVRPRPLAPGEEALVDAIDPAPILAHTLGWAAHNSGTGNLAGVAAMAGALADAFSVLPGPVTLAEPEPVTTVRADGSVLALDHGRHLVVRVRPEAARRVLLTGHLDTVYPADHPLQQCHRQGPDTIVGPGTADMKGGLALMLAGVAAFEAGSAFPDSARLGYDVLVNSDEETGSRASAGLIAALARGKLAALTYEPALPGGGIARARPGSGNFAFVVRGRAAHAGRNPQDGRNAIAAASDLALRLHALARPGLSVNPARIDGGGPDNVVPDLAVLRVNVRPAGPADLAAATAAIESALAEVARAHEVAITAHGGFHRPPKPIDAGTERLFALVHEAAAALGDRLDWRDTGGVCDGNLIAAAGVPSLDTMGARGGAIHSADEFLEVASLAERARLTALVLHRLESGAVAS